MKDKNYKGIYTAVTAVIAVAVIIRIAVMAFIIISEHLKEILPEDKKDFTVMVYMIGSDLESDGACATEDLNEMIESEIGSNVTVAVQTGGTKTWHNNMVDGGVSQRFVIRDNDIIEKENLGRLNMVETDTVSDFIQWAEKTCPADRYAMIFWNHGGGAALGFGFDEYFTEGELMLDDVSEALKNGGVHMDFIGFDACLMAGIETAMAVSDYADFLVASEETEPGGGWYYTDWLSELEANPYMPSDEICRNIVDGYMDNADGLSWHAQTLSVIDLSKTDMVYEAMCDFMDASGDVLENSGYRKIVEARSNAKSYGEAEYDQIDIASYVSLTDMDEGNEVISAVSEAVVYNRSNIDEACGMSMYYPYIYLDDYQYTMEHIASIISDDEYRNFFNVFVNIVAYTADGKETGDEDYGLFGWSFKDSGYSKYDWYDESIGEKYTSQLEKLTDEDLELDYENGRYLLRLTDEQWDIVSQLELQVFLDDGEGYIDLGGDNVYEFDDEGSLIVDFDYTWVALDGIVVPFYSEEEGTKSDGVAYSYGYVPAVLNGDTDIQIMVYWDENNINGIVSGYYIDYGDDSTFPSRSIIDFEEGDLIEFYYDYYNYDGEYEESYYYSSGERDAEITYEGEISVSYEYVADYDAVICYCLEDIYLNRYWTDFVDVRYEDY